MRTKKITKEDMDALAVRHATIDRLKAEIRAADLNIENIALKAKLLGVEAAQKRVDADQALKREQEALISQCAVLGKKYRVDFSQIAYDDETGVIRPLLEGK